jgi:hypothetical protein
MAKRRERGELREDEIFEFAPSLKFNETAIVTLPAAYRRLRTCTD